MVRIRSPKDACAGLFFLLVGIAGYALIWDLPMGAAVRMGPGYIPKSLSCIMMGFGLLVGGRSFIIDGEALEGWKLRPLLIIPLSILLFGFLIDGAGLVVAAIALMLVSTLAGREVFWRETVIFAVCMAAGTAVVFHAILGLPMRVWPI